MNLGTAGCDHDSIQVMFRYRLLDLLLPGLRAGVSVSNYRSDTGQLGGKPSHLGRVYGSGYVVATIADKNAYSQGFNVHDGSPPCCAPGGSTVVDGPGSSNAADM
jgi:hypothetical protein